MNLFSHLAVMLHVGLAKLSEERRSDKGVTAAEYGLILALIAVVIITAVSLLGDNLSDIFNESAGEVGGGTP